MHDAFRTLVRYSISRGAEGIVFTCSDFRGVIDACAKEFPIPMIGPNEAMIEKALDAGSKFAVMATVGPTIPSFSAGMPDVAAARGRKIELVPYVVDGAFDALVSANAREISGCDAIVLAQFPLSRPVPALAGVSTLPVFNSPGATVTKIRRLPERRAGGLHCGAAARWRCPGTRSPPARRARLRSRRRCPCTRRARP